MYCVCSIIVCVIACKHYWSVHKNRFDLFTIHEEAKKYKIMKETSVRLPHLNKPWWRLLVLRTKFLYLQPCYTHA